MSANDAEREREREREREVQGCMEYIKGREEEDGV